MTPWDEDVLRSLSERRPDPFIRRAVDRELAELGIDLSGNDMGSSSG